MQDLNLNNSQSFFKRGLELIQLFPQKTQDLRVAYSSLVVVAYLSWDLAQGASKLSGSFFKDVNPASDEAVKIRAVRTFVGWTTILTVFSGFYNFAKLPIKIEYFLTISVAVIATRIFIQSRIDRD